MTVYGAALNFQGALAALGDAAPPKAPILYLKPRNTWIASGEPIPCPEGVEALRVAGTLGVVIGRTACRVAERDAFQFIGAYTVVNDVSVPEASLFRPPIRSKCRDGFCPIGPRVPPVAGDIEIRVLVNGRLQATATTAELVRPIGRLIADVTEFMTLAVGDILLVGEPENAPLASIGDVVRVDIPGVGWLENPIRSAG